MFALGLLAIVMMLALGLIVALAPELLSGSKQHTVAFRDLGTLSAGAQVRQAGFVIGRVAAIKPRRDREHYLVEMSIDADVALPPGSRLRIEEPNPLRSAFVAVVVSGAECGHLHEPADPAAVMQACDRPPTLVETTLATMLQAKAAVDQIQQITQLVRPEAVALSKEATVLVASLKELSGKVDGFFDKGRQDQLVATLKNVQAMSESTARAMKTVNDVTLARLNQTLAGASGTLTAVKSATESATRLVADNQKPLETSVEDARYILSVTATSMSQLSANLEQMSGNLAEFTRQLRENPTAVVRGRPLADPPAAARPR